MNRTAYPSSIIARLSRSSFAASDGADSAGSIVTRYQLEQYAGGDPSSGGNAVEVHIHRLRRKLGADLITTVRGVGYILEDGNG